MNAAMLREAYSRGIFPWSEDPVRWYSPDPRAIFLRETVQVPGKIGKAMRHHGLRVTFDTAFDAVIRACSEEHQTEGVWIGPQFIRAYGDLHQEGQAHSVEVWQDATLVGGLYGVQLGAMFAGESMFYRVPNASKVAFAYLVQHLWSSGALYIDAQVMNEHTARLGAVQVRRRDFLHLLEIALQTPCDPSWPQEPGPLTGSAL